LRLLARDHCATLGAHGSHQLVQSPSATNASAVARLKRHGALRVCTPANAHTANMCMQSLTSIIRYTSRTSTSHVAARTGIYRARARPGYARSNGTRNAYARADWRCNRLDLCQLVLCVQMHKCVGSDSPRPVHTAAEQCVATLLFPSMTIIVKQRIGAGTAGLPTSRGGYPGAPKARSCMRKDAGAGWGTIRGRLAVALRATTHRTPPHTVCQHAERLQESEHETLRTFGVRPNTTCMPAARSCR
jgi:hypothetical protein